MSLRCINIDLPAHAVKSRGATAESDAELAREAAFDGLAQHRSEKQWQLGVRSIDRGVGDNSALISLGCIELQQPYAAHRHVLADGLCRSLRLEVHEVLPSRPQAGRTSIRVEAVPNPCR